MNGQIFFSHGKSNLCDVFIAFFDIKSVIFTKEISDNNCCTLVLQVKTDDEIYLLVNLYTSNTEQEQLETLHELETFLLKYDVNEYNLSGDINIFFNASLEATGRNAKLKTHTVGKFLELKGKFDLCDKTFNFRQKHFSGFIQIEDWITFVFHKIFRKEQEM